MPKWYQHADKLKGYHRKVPCKQSLNRHQYIFI